MSMTADLKSKDLLGKLIECVQLRMTKAPRQELRVGSQANLAISLYIDPFKLMFLAQRFPLIVRLLPG